jgi:hypothetical protein
MRNDFVKSPSGLLLPVPVCKMGAHGVYKVEHVRNGKVIDVEFFDNIITNQGLDYILGAALTGVTPVTTWYVAPFEGNYVPVATDTAATIVANATENTTYSSSTRVLWVGVEGTQQATNSASVATFTFVLTPSATKTLYGAMLVSASAKSSVSGTLLSAAQFATPKTVGNTDQLLFTYTIVASSI